jgi:oligopeptidase B
MNPQKIIGLTVLGASLLAGRMGEGHEPPGGRMPPKAAVIPKKLEKFGRTRIDDYYWLRDRSDPKVVAYLDAENAYTDAAMAHTKALQRALYDEIVGRIKQADTTAPVFDNGYYYSNRFEAGKQYPILLRKRGSLEAGEEILLDENALAEGHGYYVGMKDHH